MTRNITLFLLLGAVLILAGVALALVGGDPQVMEVLPSIDLPLLEMGEPTRPEPEAADRQISQARFLRVGQVNTELTAKFVRVS